MDLSNVRIETERLLLVPVTMQYKEVIFKEFQEPVTEFMYPKAATKIEETEAFIRTSAIQIHGGSDLIMVILNKTTKEFLGCAGLHSLRHDDPELGLWLKLSAHGNKYGLEAMKGAKDWVDKYKDYHHLRYPVVDLNIPSRKIAEGLGGVITKEYTKQMLSGIVYKVVEYWIKKNIEQGTRNVE
jgi:ribosomal-protein-alanine N-acetyltransferase